MHVGSVAVDVKAASDELTVAVLSKVVFGTEPIAALTGDACVRRNASLVMYDGVLLQIHWTNSWRLWPADWIIPSFFGDLCCQTMHKCKKRIHNYCSFA